MTVCLETNVVFREENMKEIDTVYEGPAWWTIYVTTVHLKIASTAWSTDPEKVYDKRRAAKFWPLGWYTNDQKPGVQKKNHAQVILLNDQKKAALKYVLFQGRIIRI